MKKPEKFSIAGAKKELNALRDFDASAAANPEALTSETD